MTADVQQYLTDTPRLGQGTAVEQSRAIAEVQAAIVVAQQCPRDITRAVRDMQRSCAQKSLAEKAFFRYSRGGSQISGPSVQLARELARCFGNMQYGLVEMRRDDAFGQSEMLAFAWDVETNTRSSTTFIVPHRRDKKDSAPVALTDMRDIYENNANHGARRLREMIFAVLPGWFTEDAQAACYSTLADVGDGESLTQRIDRAVKGFAALEVTVSELEQKLGAPSSKWTPYDLATLQVIYRSLQRGEARKEEEFPPSHAQDRVTVTEVTGQPGPSPAAGIPAAEPPSVPGDDGREDSTVPGTASAAQVEGIDALYMSQFGFKKNERPRTVVISEQVIGRELTGPHTGRVHANLSAGEAVKLRDTLEAIDGRAALDELLTSPMLPVEDPS